MPTGCVVQRLSTIVERVRVESNCYRVCVSDERIERFCNFTCPETSISGALVLVDVSSNHEGTPPPDPRLFILHATHTRVPHTSGATKFFRCLDQDVNKAKDLAFDKSSVHLVGNTVFQQFASCHFQ
ncbi:hypothetical protein BDM02DRAFT_3120759 [Thelephora ganbajun]|uniref:Uncharacterized protein n=1 Tax=Thelephora ganbajun TaxID=370292 RepID=A0ACB6Z651_THEGA|nr:hypothetical protein BDM02DRAFT_3120759 [Thelephora ganbajun]